MGGTWNLILVISIFGLLSDHGPLLRYRIMEELPITGISLQLGFGDTRAANHGLWSICPTKVDWG